MTDQNERITVALIGALLDRRRRRVRTAGGLATAETRREIAWFNRELRRLRRSLQVRALVVSG